MKYGQAPEVIGQFEVECKEMMFYQYLPVKMACLTKLVFESRLDCFKEIIGAACCDYVAKNGLDAFVASYVYVTAKYLYQTKNASFNRPGWHCDGFMTDDINYVWCDKNPTVFNLGNFDLSMDDSGSLVEMEEQAIPELNFTFKENALLRLNQFNVHKVADNQSEGMRAFLKVSFSKDKYNLIGNSHNYLIDYNWEMKQRSEQRNIPQSIPKTPPNPL